MMMTTSADVALAAVIVGSISGTVIVMVTTFARVRIAREQARLSSLGEGDLRLQRLEQAIDAIAVEVERMSESQRFTAKILADRLPASDRSISSTHTS